MSDQTNAEMFNLHAKPITSRHVGHRMMTFGLHYIQHLAYFLCSSAFRHSFNFTLYFIFNVLMKCGFSIKFRSILNYKILRTPKLKCKFF